MTARLPGQVAGGATTRFGYDGLSPVAELDANGNTLRHHVFGHHVFGRGPSTGSGQAYDQPLVTYEGAGFTDRRYLHADERGSIVALSDNSGARVGLNSYDEYGKPGAANSGRFQYTGQMWLPELGVHYYKARMYAQHLGRFYQPDPIGYWGGMNLYAYVGNDPVNLVDPLGLCPPGYFAYNAGGYTTATETVVDRECAPFPGRDSIPGLSARGPEFGGAGGGGSGLGPQVTIRLPDPKPTVPCKPTPSQLVNSGLVTYKFTEGILTSGLWSSHLEGTFVSSKGYSGRFETFSSGVFVGRGTGIAVGGGRSHSLATFIGTNYNIVGALGLLSISDNFSTDFSHVGQTDAGATLGLGIGATVSETKITGVHCPAR